MSGGLPGLRARGGGAGAGPAGRRRGGAGAGGGAGAAGCSAGYPPPTSGGAGSARTLGPRHRLGSKEENEGGAPRDGDSSARHVGGDSGVPLGLPALADFVK